MEVYIISEDAASSAAAASEDNQSSSSGLLSIKVQGRGRRETININISPTDPLGMYDTQEVKVSKAKSISTLKHTNY